MLFGIFFSLRFQLIYLILPFLSNSFPVHGWPFQCKPKTFWWIQVQEQLLYSQKISVPLFWFRIKFVNRQSWKLKKIWIFLYWSDNSLKAKKFARFRYFAVFFHYFASFRDFAVFFKEKIKSFKLVICTKN